MFTNKHVVAALIIAPILSILAWYAVGNLLGEQPAPATPGGSYPLIANGNCRYASGQCELENADFSITLRVDDRPDGSQELTAVSAHRLEGVRVALVEPGEPEGGGRRMQQTDRDGRHWSLALDARPGAETRILLAAGAGGSTWFGDAASRFARPEERAIPNPQ